MDFRSKLPTYSSARPSGIRPPGSTLNRKSSISDNSAGPKYGYGSRNTVVPGSATSRTSIYPISRPSQSTAFSAQKNNMAMSARKSKVGLFGMTPQSTKRPSFNPGTASSAGRRSSIIGQSRHITESRPLSDRNFHMQTFQKVFQFLQDNGFASQLAPKFVTAPTMSDVRKIFEFLFLLLDDHVKITHLDTDVPTILKALGYPYQCNKSHLVSWASPQAKGHLFGMFDWLVDAVSYSRNTETPQLLFSTYNNDDDSTAEIFKLILEGGGEGPECDEVLENLALKKFGTKEEFDQLNDELEQLEGEIVVQDEEIEKIRQMPDTVVAYKKDMTRYDDYIRNMQTHISSNEETFSQLTKEHDERKAMFNATKKNRDELVAQVKEQDFGLEEVDWARDRQRLLEDEIRSEELAVEDLKKNIRMFKLELTKCEDTLNKMYHDASSWINGLREVISSPSIAQYVKTLENILSQPEVENLCKFFSDKSTTDKTDKNMRALFSTIINKIKMSILEQLTGLEGMVRTDEQQKLSETEMSLTDMEKHNCKIQGKTDELKSELDEIRKQQGAEWSSLQSDYETNKQYFIELDAKVKGSQKEMKERLQKLKKDLQNEVHVAKKDKDQGLKGFKEFAEKQKREVLGVINCVQQHEARLTQAKADMENELSKQVARCNKLKKTFQASHKR